MGGQLSLVCCRVLLCRSCTNTTSWIKFLLRGLYDIMPLCFIHFLLTVTPPLWGRLPLNSEIIVPDSWLEKSEAPRKTFWLAQGQGKNMPARTEFITREGNFHHEKLGFLTVEMAGHREVGHEVSKGTAKNSRCCLHICQIVHHTPVAVLLRHGLTIPHSHGNCGLV